jgi:hypothetical protein
MRILTLNLLAVALLLFGASSASAFALNWAARGSTTSLTTSDTVTVDVFLDADPGLQLLSVSVLFPDDGSLTYDGPASAALPPSSVGSSGAQASYILYSPANMVAMTPAVTIYPQQIPYWLYWTGTLPPGQQQVNINYADSTFTGSGASGTGIYIATLVFHVEPGLVNSSLEMALTSGGNILQAGGEILASSAVGPGTVPVGAPIVITGVPVPEPTTAALIGLGVLGLAMAGRRRA